MNQIEIPEAGFSADIPASYSEMSGPQVCYVMQQLHALQSAKMSHTEFRVRVLYHLAGIKRTARSIAWERLHPAAANRRAEKVVLLAEELLGFLFTTTGEKLTPVFDSITNHVPTLRIGPVLLVGPGDGLFDISFGELIAADADLALYTATGDERHIDNMIARLYRRDRYNHAAAKSGPSKWRRPRVTPASFAPCPNGKNSSSSSDMPPASTTSNTALSSSAAARYPSNRYSVKKKLTAALWAGWVYISTSPRSIFSGNWP